MGWLAFDAVADALELLSRAKVRCDTKIFFWEDARFLFLEIR
jgi:hypothetical protein